MVSQSAQTIFRFVWRNCAGQPHWPRASALGVSTGEPMAQMLRVATAPPHANQTQHWLLASRLAEGGAQEGDHAVGNTVR